MNVRYWGNFCDTKGHLWGVEILQDGWEGQAGELTFPGSGALVINWDETDKIEPVQSSTATLTIESPGDRTYIDLYTVKPGNIALRVKRDGELWWTGCLDPEFYEEPYERADRYDVQLTFSDFGILDRLKWSLSEFVTVENVVKISIMRSGIDSTGGYALKCSTQLDNTPLTLGRLTVIGTNFFDEDDKPMTLREVLKAVLQPLGLRIIQRAGTVTVYDINALAGLTADEEIYWSSDRQTLSADKVVNNAGVTFSPYQAKELIDATIDADSTVASGPVMTVNNYTSDGGEYPGFEFCLVQNDSKIPFALTNASLYKMTPVFSGSQSAGVVLGLQMPPMYNIPINMQASPASMGLGFTTMPTSRGKVVITSRKRYIGKIDPSIAGNYRIKVTLDSLFDVRKNPFEDPTSSEKKAYNDFVKYVTYGWIPGAILLKDKNGNILYHYKNRSILTDFSAYPNVDGWVAGAPSIPDTYLFCYYDWNDRIKNAPWNGWQTNRQAIGPIGGTLPSLYQKRGDGDYIPMPPAAGFLEVQVLDDLYLIEVWNNFNPTWYLIKDLKAEIVDQFGRDIDSSDIEYNAWINPDAKEEMAISTLCGTYNKALPGARGLYLRTSDNTPVASFKRAGVTDTCEKLLIGTIYSNYSERHTRLEGECNILEGALPVCAEVNQPADTLFMISGESQKCDEGVADTTFVEVKGDNFEGIKWNE